MEDRAGRPRDDVSRRRRAQALAPRAAEPLNVEQALARFRHLVGRVVTLRFVAYGPVLRAANDEKLAEKFEEWLAAEAWKQRPS